MKLLSYDSVSTKCLINWEFKMKRTSLLNLIIWVLLVTNIINAQTQQRLAQLSGEYLGQKPPGAAPEIFAPGIVSLGFHELGISFTPDLKEMFYIMSDRNYKLYVLIHRKVVGGIWAEAELVPFSGEYSIYAQCLSSDGNTMYFSGKHPVKNETKDDQDIWMVKRNKTGWGKPERLGDFINTDKSDIVHSVSGSGDLYFFRESNLYISRAVNNHFEYPVEVDNDLNRKFNACRPFVSPNDDYLIFHANHKKGLGGNDLYIIYKKNDGSWTEPVNLGETVNSSSHDFGPYVSPDGKYLFFSSYRAYDPSVFKNKTYDELLKLYREPLNGYATLYWMDTNIINDLRLKIIE